MFLKQKKNLKWMILKEKNFGSRGKIHLTVPLQKVHKIVLHILLFQSILSFFFYFEKKNCIFKRRGSTPPPLADASTKNASFFHVLPKFLSSPQILVSLRMTAKKVTPQFPRFNTGFLLQFSPGFLLSLVQGSSFSVIQGYSSV